MQSVHSIWGKVAFGAAEETIKAVLKTSGIELVLRDVPMDTFQVFVGRQHQLGVEVDGVSYELMLGNEADLVERAKALPSGSMESSGLVAQDWWSKQGDRALALPESTLAGPLELVLVEPSPINVYTPLAADVGIARRILIEAGATVHVSGMKRISLRRAVDLPRLPGQYLAEAYAHARLGQPEEGFNYAPGILYMAAQLKARASNSSSSKHHDVPLLSFEVEPVEPGALTLRSAPHLPHEAVGPKLKVRKLNTGTVEVSLRQGQVSQADSGSSLAALTHMWAWPLPHVDMSHWVPYETLLRSILSAHPFNVDKVIKSGIGLRLTKSAMQGVHLVAFDMEVRAKAQRPPELEDSPFEFNETPLEVWEAVVQVQAQPDGGHRYVPLHVKRKASYQNTVTMSRTAILMALAGGKNETLGLPLGYDEEH